MSNSFYFLKINGKIQKFEYIYSNNDRNEIWKNIPFSEFLSVNEIVEHQLKELPAETKVDFSKMAEDDLIMMHHTYGTWIRNSYGLWHPNNPFVIKNDLGDGHPDGLSMLVIKGIHKRLTTIVVIEDAFQDAMSIVQEK